MVSLRQETRERRIITDVKPFIRTLRVTNPVRQSRASSRKRVLRRAGRPSLRSVVPCLSRISFRYAEYLSRARAANLSAERSHRLSFPEDDRGLRCMSCPACPSSPRPSPDFFSRAIETVCGQITLCWETPSSGGPRMASDHDGCGPGGRVRHWHAQCRRLEPSWCTAAPSWDILAPGPIRAASHDLVVIACGR